MFWILVSIAWPLLILWLIVRGQFKEKDIPGQVAPIILGATGLFTIFINAGWFRLTFPVAAYLLAGLALDRRWFGAITRCNG